MSVEKGRRAYQRLGLRGPYIAICRSGGLWDTPGTVRGACTGSHGPVNGLCVSLMLAIAVYSKNSCL